jgi:hypothetical protein
MATKETTQTQKVEDFFTGMFEGQWERTQALVDNVSKMEKKGYEQTVTALDEVNRLFKANLEYARELQEQGYKMAMDNWRRSFEMMRPGK